MDSRYGYRGLAFIGWVSDQPDSGVKSPPTVAITVDINPKLGFSFGSRFYLRSFYVTPYCRDYVKVNVTGYVRVCLKPDMP